MLYNVIVELHCNVFHLTISRKRLFDPPPEEVQQHADRPGGFNWGEPLAGNQDAPPQDAQ